MTGRGADGVRVAYLTSVYHSLSHTFIEREVTALRQHGVSVSTFSVRAPRPGQPRSAADAAAAASTEFLLPARAGRLFRAHATALLRSPGAYLRVLMQAPSRASGGLRSVLYQVFYFVEAMLLWHSCTRQGIRHVHAHFANNGADIARIVRDYGREAGQTWSWSFTMHGPTELFDVKGFGLAGKATSADFVACISDFARSQLMSLTAQDHWDKLGVVHCGVDTDRFIPRWQPRPEGPLRVLFVGRLVAEKGPGLLLSATRDLARRGTPVDVRVVGDGPERTALEAGAPNGVTFLGAVDQDRIGECFAWADVLCLPSFAEGVPVVLMEAMACGLPVVTTRIAGIGELVRHEVDGLVVAPGRSDLLVEALVRLAENPRERESMGVSGRGHVQQSYSTPHMVRPLIDLLTRHAPGCR